VTPPSLRGWFKARYARRLAAAFVATALLAAALTTALVNAAFQDRFSRYVQDQQQQRTNQIVAAAGDIYQQSHRWDTQALDALAVPTAMTGSTLQIRDAAGRIVYDTNDHGQLPAMGAMHRQMMGAGPLGPTQSVPIVVDGTRVGSAVLAVPSGGLPGGEQAFRSSVNRLLLVGGLIAAAAALLLGVVLARRLTRPVRDLAAAAADLAAGNRSTRAAVTSTDELGDLTATFNEMATALQREDDLRRGFVAAVAHELRTPLTILRSEIEAVQDAVRPSTPELFDSLHDETVRLGRLVADLETLAAADAATFTVSRAPHDLSTVAADAVEGLRRRFAEAAISVKTELSPVTVLGDPVRLSQVVTNLLTNAAKFTPSGGRVVLTVSEDGDQATLTVADTGSEIPPDELAHVFERFFRGRNARAGGSGIGLTVASELVAAHGGRLTVTSLPGNGTTFRVTLPALPSSPSRTNFTGPSPAPVTVGIRSRDRR